MRLQSRKMNKHVLADLCALIRGSFYQMIGVQAILFFDEKMEKQFLTKIGVKSIDEAEKIMKNKGNDELKKKYYYVMLDEMVNFVNEEIKKTKEEEIWIDDMSVTVKKINGKWQVQDTNN